MLDNLYSSVNQSLNMLSAQVADLTATAQALLGMLVGKGVVSIEEFNKMKEGFFEAQPELAESKQAALDAIRVAAIFDSGECSEEDKAFLKQYYKDNGLEDAEVDDLIESIKTSAQFKDLFGDALKGVF